MSFENAFRNRIAEYPQKWVEFVRDLHILSVKSSSFTPQDLSEETRYIASQVGDISDVAGESLETIDIGILSASMDNSDNMLDWDDFHGFSSHSLTKLKCLTLMCIFASEDQVFDFFARHHSTLRSVWFHAVRLTADGSWLNVLRRLREAENVHSRKLKHFQLLACEPRGHDIMNARGYLKRLTSEIARL